MTAYGTDGWSDLFVAAAGAGAVLTGLIFVAVSVNIRAVLDAETESGGDFLTGRALEALVALLNVLVISIVGLVPTIPRGAFSAFILLVAAESAISPVRALWTSRADTRRDRKTVLRVVTAFALTAALIATGVTLAAGHGGGLFWLPVAFVLAIFIAAVNAWVLLVEVMRQRNRDHDSGVTPTIAFSVSDPGYRRALRRLGAFSQAGR